MFNSVFLEVSRGEGPDFPLPKAENQGRVSCARGSGVRVGFIKG